jgi:hypothetical protein
VHQLILLAGSHKSVVLQTATGIQKTAETKPCTTHSASGLALQKRQKNKDGLNSP